MATIQTLAKSAIESQNHERLDVVLRMYDYALLHLYAFYPTEKSAEQHPISVVFAYRIAALAGVRTSNFEAVADAWHKVCAIAMGITVDSHVVEP